MITEGMPSVHLNDETKQKYNKFNQLSFFKDNLHDSTTGKNHWSFKKNDCHNNGEINLQNES